MAVAISSGLTDDNDFIDLLNSLLNGLLVQQAPEQLWVVQIDNWFDHKWLRYSGNGSTGSKFPVDWTSPLMDRFDCVKAEFWQDKLTFPPFAPAECWASGPLCILAKAMSRLRSRSCHTVNLDAAAILICRIVLRSSLTRLHLFGTVATR